MLTPEIMEEYHQLALRHKAELIDILKLPEWFPDQQIFRQLQMKLHQQCEESYLFYDALCQNAMQQCAIAEKFGQLEQNISKRAEQLLTVRKQVQ